ncbi:dNA-binding protein [Seminavis robusta]|uniref:DNA-binding protein n=1 Tax=Seminavis robusta TaxID=568900 RepID=A0A9N8EWR3_9STRA|nr:dNA-binding protein [Seminavis robusta]|eukprot:Sro2064_g313160.1 dNA-binding protein (188) ;mRNA; f:10509-11072
MAIEPNDAMELAVVSSPLQSHAVRIPANADLVPSLLEAAHQAMQHSKAQSAFVMTAVGSLSTVTLRMAATDKQEPRSSKKRKAQDEGVSLAGSTALQVKTFPNHFEIVSLVGTFSKGGGKHLHMSVSNAQGQVLGGHLVGGKVFTTLELVLGTMPGVAFTREMDEISGYKELVVKPQQDTNSAEEKN